MSKTMNFTVAFGAAQAVKTNEFSEMCCKRETFIDILTNDKANVIR
jgi:hypothetical protein